MDTKPHRHRTIHQKLIDHTWPLLLKAHELFTPRLDLESLDFVLVLGNQKTGSTAIAELLGRLGRLRIVTDIHPLQSPDTRIQNDPTSAARMIQRMRYYFRRDLIKENELTPATGALLDVLPQVRPVYVVRHPVHNIRSILDRVGLPGHPQSLNELTLSDDGWRPIVSSRFLGIEAGDHITSLAKRWNYMTTIYQHHQERLHLVRYEDFMADKLGSIQTLADRIGIRRCQDIEPLLDVSFQPRGAHRSTDPREFFSDEALSIISQHCTEGMKTLEYEPIPHSP